MQITTYVCHGAVRRLGSYFEHNGPANMLVFDMSNRESHISFVQALCPGTISKSLFCITCSTSTPARIVNYPILKNSLNACIYITLLNRVNLRGITVFVVLIS